MSEKYRFRSAAVACGIFAGLCFPRFGWAKISYLPSSGTLTNSAGESVEYKRANNTVFTTTQKLEGRAVPVESNLLESELLDLLVQNGQLSWEGVDSSDRGIPGSGVFQEHGVTYQYQNLGEGYFRVCKGRSSSCNAVSSEDLYLRLVECGELEPIAATNLIGLRIPVSGHYSDKGQAYFYVYTDQGLVASWRTQDGMRVGNPSVEQGRKFELAYPHFGTDFRSYPPSSNFPPDSGSYSIYDHGSKLWSVTLFMKRGDGSYLLAPRSSDWRRANSGGRTVVSEEGLIGLLKKADRSCSGAIAATTLME